MKSLTIWVFHIMPEGMEQQVEFESEAHQSPVLVRKICKERLPVANITDIFNGPHVKIFSHNLHRLIFLSVLLFIAFFLFLLLILVLLILFFCLFATIL